MQSDLDKYILINQANFHIETVFRCKTFLWKSVLRVLQWSFYCSIASGLYLRNGGEFLCCKRSQALCASLWYDRKKLSSHPTPDASPSCGKFSVIIEWGKPFRLIDRFPCLGVLPVRQKRQHYFCWTKEERGGTLLGDREAFLIMICL